MDIDWVLKGSLESQRERIKRPSSKARIITDKGRSEAFNDLAVALIDFPVQNTILPDQVEAILSGRMIEVYLTNPELEIAGYISKCQAVVIHT